MHLPEKGLQCITIAPLPLGPHLVRQSICDSSVSCFLVGLWVRAITPIQDIKKEVTMIVCVCLGLIFTAVLKHHNQKQFGEERVYFSFYFIVHHVEHLGMCLEAAAWR